MKKLLVLLFASLLVLGACGQKEESKLEDKKETKSSSKDKKKDDNKKSNDVKKGESVKKDDSNADRNQQANAQQTQNVEQQQSTQEPVQTQQKNQGVEDSQNNTTNENLINRDAEFYDSLPADSQEKLQQQNNAMAGADEDDPRWDEQLEINMRDDITDAEREKLSNDIWSN